MHRRTLLAAPLLLALPARAQDGWSAVADRARGLDQLHSLSVMQDGAEVFAEAFRGPALSRAVNVKSVSKTLVAAVLGAAIDRGVVPGVGASLARVAPKLIPKDAAEGVGAITLGDLVTMRAGLARTSGPNYGAWVSSRNWVSYALSQPMIDRPGGRMLYSTGSFHVLGAALAEASGQSLLAMMRDWIGRPAGIEIPAWTRDPQGYYLGGNEMALTPAGMLAFGEMYRNGGRVGDRQVLSEAWVTSSMEPRTRSPFSGLDYGYGWFLGRAGGARIALARGYGGQAIAVLPELNATLAITSDIARPARSGGYFGDLMDLIGDSVVPALSA